MKYMCYLLISLCICSLGYAQENKLDISEARYQELLQVKDKIPNLVQQQKELQTKSASLERELDSLKKYDPKDLPKKVKDLENELRILQKNKPNSSKLEEDIKTLEEKIKQLTLEKNGLSAQNIASERRKLQEDSTKIAREQKEYAEKLTKLQANQPAIEALQRNNQDSKQAIEALKSTPPQVSSLEALQTKLQLVQAEQNQARTDSLANLRVLNEQVGKINTLKNKQGELQGLATEKQVLKNQIKTTFEETIPQLIKSQNYDLTKVQKLIQHCDNPLISDVNPSTWKSQLQEYEVLCKAMQQSKDRLNNPYEDAKNKAVIADLSAMLSKSITEEQKKDVNKNITLLKAYCDLSALVYIFMSNSDAYLLDYPEEVPKEMNTLLRQRPALKDYPFLMNEINQRIRNSHYKYKVRDVKCN